MDPRLEAVDQWLRTLETEFWLICVNLDGQQHRGEPTLYETVTEARLAMLRKAYNRGVQDASPQRDFETDVERVHELNKRNREQANAKVS